MNYYNEFDPKAAAWLRELIKAGHIPAGEVDERSICDVSADDVRGFTQCHFFAGIGGWPYALRLAGWPDDRPVWTGSCPCQPFSCAGKGLGAADKRHLWPDFFRLIRECGPDRIFGEQVEGAVGKGWLDGVFGDLEAEGYACGAAVLGAHSVGAPHIRQRLYWMAYADNGRRSERRPVTGSCKAAAFIGQPTVGLANTTGMYRPEHEHESRGGLRRGPSEVNTSERGSACGVADSASGGFRIDGSAPRQSGHVAQCDTACGMVDSNDAGLERHGRHVAEHDAQGREGAQRHTRARGFWDGAIWHLCRDGKRRRIPVEPALFPLAHGLPHRVVKLRGSGNAIVPQVAAEFIQACEEACGDVT